MRTGGWLQLDHSARDTAPHGMPVPLQLDLLTENLCKGLVPEGLPVPLSPVPPPTTLPPPPLRVDSPMSAAKAPAADRGDQARGSPQARGQPLGMSARWSDSRSGQPAVCASPCSGLFVCLFVCLFEVVVPTV